MDSLKQRKNIKKDELKILNITFIMSLYFIIFGET